MRLRSGPYVDSAACGSYPPHYQRRFDDVLDFLGERSPALEAGGIGAAYLSLDCLPVETQTFAEELTDGLHRRLGFRAPPQALLRVSSQPV